MQNSFLHLSNWWGLSSKPGHKDMWINNDGSYVIKTEYSKPQDKSGDFTKEGKFDEAKMKEIVAFVEKNITQDIKNAMQDAGFGIESKDFKVENDMNLWKKIVDLIPEYNQH